MNKPEKNLKNRNNKISRPLSIKNITFPEKRIITARWIHLLLWAVLGFIVFFSVINAIYPHLFWHHFTLEDYPLHSTIESLGAIAAILIAFMPLQVLFGKYRPSYIFLSTGFWVMGLLDLFHSFLREGHGFVFTHAMALLAGGFFFALFVFPWKFNADKAKKYFLLISGILTIVLAAIVSFSRETFPEMFHDGVFTPVANNINMLAGILFFLSAIKLLIIYNREKNLGVLILVFTAVTSAIVGFTFQYSSAWSDSWWLWHAIRLIAFLAVLGFMFWRIQALSDERNEALREIKENHNKLMASEERFSLVNEATKQGLWDWNVPENIVYFSPVWKMQVGYKDDELENDFGNWIKLLHPDDKERCMKAVDDYLKNPEGKFILEFRFQHKDGHYVWIHNQAASVKDKDGNVLRMFGAHTDITAQKEAEEKLRDREKLFRIIFENSPLGKSRTGLDGSLNINKAFSDITGYNLEELQQKNWKEITHPDDVKKSEKAIKSLMAGEQESAQFEKRYLHKAGHYVWTEVNTSLHRNEAGEPQFFITAITDITKRKEAEQLIKESEKKFKGLFKNDPSAVLIADPETGLLTDVNPAAENLMEMSREELIGLHQSKLHPEEIVEEQVEKFKKLQGQPNVTVESVVLTKSGKRKPVEIKVSMVEINGKPQIIGIFHDISTLVEKQQQLKQSEQKHRAIFESATDAFLIVSMEGKIVEANPAACEVYGYKYQEILGKPAIELIHPDYHKNFADFQKDIQMKGYYSGETIDLRKDGTTFNSEVQGTMINFNNQPHLLGIVRDVTQQKEIRKKLQAEKEFSDSVINALPGVFYLFDKNGKLLKWNRQFAELAGFTQEEAAKKSPLDFIAEHHRDKIAKAIQTTFETGDVMVQADYNAKGNSPIPYLFSGRIIQQNNEPLLVGIGVDITQRVVAEKEKERALNELNERMKEIRCLFQINEAIKNPEVNVTDVMNKITGFIPDGWQYPDKTSVEIKLDDKLYRSEGFETSSYLLEEEINIEKTNRGYIRIYVSDLNEHQAKKPFLDEEKNLLKTVAGNIGIYIERIEQEKAIRESEEKFRSVFNNSPVSLWEEDWTEVIEMVEHLKDEGITDFKKYFDENSSFVQEALPKVVIEDVNKETLEMFEAENKSELVNSLETVFATEDTLPGFVGELVALAEGKVVYETEMKLNTAKGNLIQTMLRMSFPSKNSNSGQVLVSIMDISELKKIQRQLNESMEKLQRSNKELEQFAYVASHDLQEPLRMVSSYTQLLERRYKDQLDERADKYIHYAVDGANRMQNLINDLLEFSRVSTRGEEFTETDVNEILKNTLNSLSLTIEDANAEIKTSNLPVISADEGQLERVFLNLINNAIKFRNPNKKPVIEIDVKEKNNKWLFSIKDNGIGIDEKYKEKIFVIFQRLHGAGKYKGTGIGLAICKRIVQRHGGNIWFESKEGEGTTFFFTIKKHKKN